MPRDSKGQPFGIDTMVQTPTGPMKVCGFLVNDKPLTREQITTVAEMGCCNCDTPHPPRVFYWYEVESMDPDSDPWTKHEAHTDMCHADVAQRDGIKLPDASYCAVQNALSAYSPEAGMACKAVWGN